MKALIQKPTQQNITKKKTLQQTLDDDVRWYIKCNNINKIQLVTSSSGQLIKKNGRNAATTSPQHIPTTQSDQTPPQAVQSPARSYKTLSSWSTFHQYGSAARYLE